MFNFTFNQAPSIDWTTIIISIISAFIAGGFSWLATRQAHNYNRKLEEEELKTYEKATALSIIEEIKVLKNIYEKEFKNIFCKLNNTPFIEDCYEISQDYSTVYNQNAGEIGLIKNNDLRKLIIKTNLLLKKFIEELRIYNNLYNDYYITSFNFIKTVFRDYTTEDCSTVDVTTEINVMLKDIKNNNWTWLNEEYVNKEKE